MLSNRVKCRSVAKSILVVFGALLLCKLLFYNKEKPEEKENNIAYYSNFTIHHHFMKGEIRHHDSLTCICAFSSIDQLFWLIHSTRSWNGPISYAVYAPGEDWPVAVAILNQLRKCFPAIRENVDFHMVFQDEYPPLGEAVPMPDDCADAEKKIKSLGAMRSEKYKNWFPQNSLRNIARKYATTKYIMVLDGDIITCRNMYEELEQFLRTNKTVRDSEKVVYVIPTFEVRQNAPLPRNKSELMKSIHENNAQSFYSSIVDRHARVTDYERWYKFNSTFPVQISHEVTDPVFAYEPYYLSLASVPCYNDRFVGFGLNRALQVYDMTLQNYKFYVLNPIFFLHWKYHTPSVYPWYRLKEHVENMRIQYSLQYELIMKNGRTERLWDIAGL